MSLLFSKMIDDALDLISRRLANNDDFKSLSETQRHTIRTKLNINDSTSIILGTEKNDFFGRCGIYIRNVRYFE